MFHNTFESFLCFYFYYEVFWRHKLERYFFQCETNRIVKNSTFSIFSIVKKVLNQIFIKKKREDSYDKKFLFMKNQHKIIFHNFFFFFAFKSFLM